nr:HAMP domain-containing sensor histidine kinase [Mucilaginibacter sp. L294]
MTKIVPPQVIITDDTFINIPTTPTKISGADIFEIANDIILAKYPPACVVVNEAFNIIQLRGKTDTWLSPTMEGAKVNLLKIAREGLVFELRYLLHQAKKSNTSASKHNILFLRPEGQQYVDIEVTPIIIATGIHFLILFKEGSMYADKARSLNNQNRLRIEQLEDELTQTHADMDSISDEQEAIFQELQSANLELLSSGDEMQLINEELETSKEELQSTNEEIMSINDALSDRNDDLTYARTFTDGIINTIGDPLIILDENLKVKQATSGFYSKFRVNEEETEGRYIYDLGNQQWDIPALRTMLENILPQQKVVLDYEVTHIFPTIGRKIMCLNARQLEKMNGELLILLAIVDITDKRRIEEGLAEVEKLFAESKERLKLAVDAAGLGTWDYNTLTGELIWDHRCKEMFNLSAKDPITYERFINLIHAGDKAKVDKALKNALAGNNGGEYDEEFRTLESTDKKFKWLKFKGKAYFDERGISYRFVGTSLDISVQKMLDEATIELLKQKDDFMSIASHELKTPITSLKASLQLLDKMKNAPVPAMLTKLITVANKSMEKVNNLVEDLLNVSKLNQGQLHIHKSIFSIVDVIDNCCHDVRAEGIFTIKTTGNKSLQVFADAGRIDQILVNFVNNAIKYAPQSKVIIINIEKKDTMIKVSVSDKGPGIAPDMIPNLFDRYYRVDKSGSQYSGLGLGLYICAEIIKKLDGQIGVDSEVGKGSSFWFTLPLSE